MEKQEWIDRFAAHIYSVGGLPLQDGKWVAESTYYEDRGEYDSPEDAANEEMSCWDE